MAGLAEPTAAGLRDLAGIVEPGEFVLVLRANELESIGPSWRVGDPIRLLQMVLEVPLAKAAIEVEELSEKDVDEVMELVQRTEPGPFERGTIQMGRYLGLREESRLVAMGGERQKPPGHSEISAVCTHPDAQGRGLGEAFVRAIASTIQEEGNVPFLHVYVGNERAIALYERLGFTRRTEAPIAPLVRC
jgi:predicted GNAT family acetyltransferase